MSERGGFQQVSRTKLVVENPRTHAQRPLPVPCGIQSDSEWHSSLSLLVTYLFRLVLSVCFRHDNLLLLVYTNAMQWNANTIILSLENIIIMIMNLWLLRRRRLPAAAVRRCLLLLAGGCFLFFLPYRTSSVQ